MEDVVRDSEMTISETRCFVFRQEPSICSGDLLRDLDVVSRQCFYRDDVPPNLQLQDRLNELYVLSQEALSLSGDSLGLILRIRLECALRRRMRDI